MLHSSSAVLQDTVSIKTGRLEAFELVDVGSVHVCPVPVTVNEQLFKRTCHYFRERPLLTISIHCYW